MLFKAMYFGLAMLPSIMGISVNEVEVNMVSPYSGAAAAANSYIKLRKQGIDQSAIDNKIASVWSLRFIDNDKIQALEAHEMKKAPLISENAVLTSIQLLFEDFAIAKFDDWSTNSTYVLTIFKSDGKWLIGTEVLVNDKCARPQSRYNSQLPYKKVLEELERYYLAVEADNAEKLDQIHHKTWLMKNHEEQVIVSEGNDKFKKRMDPIKKPHKTYADSREVADIQLMYDCAAVVRIDKPSSESVTVFTMLKEKGRWHLVEKSFSYNKNR